jgi:hypothetical protein
MNPFKGAIDRIREINRRYAKPRIRLSRRTRLVLLALRLYLIVLVILLAYKFFTLL